jgi:hypothetical protein
MNLYIYIFQIGSFIFQEIHLLQYSMRTIQRCYRTLFNNILKFEFHTMNVCFNTSGRAFFSILNKVRSTNPYLFLIRSDF